MERQLHSTSSVSAALREKALGALKGLPPFSPVLNKLLASLAGDDISFAQLSDLIEKDMVVTGNILHLVNSALYARRGTVNSVRHALSLMGMEKLRNVVLGMSVARIWAQVRPVGSWSTARFNQHSAATAILSDMLAQRVPVIYPEGAFVAGLMHDLGRLLIAVGLPAEHSRMMELHQRSGKTLADSEREVLGFEHPEISAQALAFWNLPDPIQAAVGEHHSTLDAAPGGEFPLSRVVAAADCYVHSTGVSILPTENMQIREDMMVLKQLGIDDAEVSTLLSEFRDEFESMAPFFR